MGAERAGINGQTEKGREEIRDRAQNRRRGPATRVYEVLTMIDPTTERRDRLAQVA